MPDILGVISGLFAEGRAPAAFLAQLQQFSMSFLKHAPERFGLQMVGGSRCGRARCALPAVAVCEGCGTTICLEHGWFSHAADSLCTKCARLAVRNISGDKSWGRGRRAEEEEIHQDAPVVPPHVIARRTLGLSDTADLSEVKRRFRSLSLTMHPDRLRHLSPAHAAEVTEAFSKYSAAYGLLEDHFRKAA